MTVRLPIISELPQPARADTNTARLSALRILVVDDEQVVAESLARLLSDELDDEDGVRRELAACCWVRYEVTRRVWDQRYDAGGRAREATSRWRTERWVHRLCAEDCPHWHHQTEVWIAMAAPPP